MQDTLSRISLTGVERHFPNNEFIVSKTDTKGFMTYVNSTFVNISGYREEELIGKPHSMIRHPHMPRCIFWLLWNTLRQGNEIFAYVMNRCKNGDHYWVFANASPMFNSQRQVIGYNSNRRLPRPQAITAVTPLYAKLLQIEQAHSNNAAGLEASKAALHQTIADLGIDYEEFVHGL